MIEPAAEGKTAPAGKELDLAVATDPRIEGERLYLRRLAVADVSEAYLGWMNDPQVNGFLESRFQEHSFATLRAFVETMARDPLNLFAGIFLKAGDVHIGNIKLGPINRHHLHADIGLLIGDRECWGKGYATEAISALTEFAFTAIGLHRVTAGAYGANQGSWRAFEKAGFMREGLLRNHWRSNDGFEDGILLGKINPAFR